MLKKDINAEHEGILDIANLICIAARTAPKGKGVDNIVTAIATEKDKEEIARKMKSIGEKNGNKTFLRDSDNINRAQVIVIIGTKTNPLKLKLCGFCGFKDCDEMEKNRGICVFNSGDLGIAIGSAVSTASIHKVDNRIMYTVGYAALEMKLLGDDVRIAYGIPLSVTGKNIFFDRK